MNSRSVLIIGLNSDIGSFLSKRYKEDGWNVYGTFRKTHVPTNYYADLDICCDLSSEESIENCVEKFINSNLVWDLIIYAAGTMEPIGKFFEVTVKEWSNSFYVNFIGPIHFLHEIWSLRTNKTKPSVVFFAGGGTNSSFDCYSAYCVSKIALIKITELLNSEYPNCNFFCIGPGFVKTKIHKETLQAGQKSGQNYQKTIDFLNTKGTSLEDIYLHIQWCLKHELLVSGRNLSTVHDQWRDASSALLEIIPKNPDFFKLRRVE